MAGGFGSDARQEEPADRLLDATTRTHTAPRRAQVAGWGIPPPMLLVAGPLPSRLSLVRVAT